MLPGLMLPGSGFLGCRNCSVSLLSVEKLTCAATRLDTLRALRLLPHACEQDDAISCGYVCRMISCAGESRPRDILLFTPVALLR